MTTYGYARVSTVDQSLDSQFEELKAAGCYFIFAEKISGKSADDRRQLQLLLAEVREGDLLLVTRLDRLARSTRDLLNVLDALGKRGVKFRSLRDAWADTTTPHGQLMITILGGLAQFERSLIVARTGEGRRRAMARGVRFGRPKKLTPHLIEDLREKLRGGESWGSVARKFGVSVSTVARMRKAKPLQAGPN